MQLRKRALKETQIFRTPRHPLITKLIRRFRSPIKNIQDRSVLGQNLSSLFPYIILHILASVAARSADFFPTGVTQLNFIHESVAGHPKSSNP